MNPFEFKEKTSDKNEIIYEYKPDSAGGHLLIGYYKLLSNNTLNISEDLLSNNEYGFSIQFYVTKDK